MVVTALASLIIPSDETGPGAKEADVTKTLDGLLARTPSRHDLYRHGLLACDEWALRKHGRSFAALIPEEQRALLCWVDPFNLSFTRTSSLGRKLLRKAVNIYRKWRCPLVALFPELCRDVMGAFYTHRVSWQWLSYDGPPMPEGYPDLSERRPSQSQARIVRNTP